VRLRPIVVGKRGRLLLRNAILLAWGTLLLLLRHGRDPVRMAHLVLLFASDTGGFWSRLPSFLANHRFAFSEAFCQVLLEWRERSDGFPFDDVRRVVEQDLGRPLEEVFETFDRNPLAATFTAQTHKAKLAAEQVIVAVKVQRPGIGEVMRADLRIAKRLRPLLIWLTRIPQANWDDGLWRFESGIAQELDYRLEATHMTRLGRRLRKHKVLVPGLYLEYSGRRTLTKDFVSGVTVAEFVKARKSDAPRAERWAQENNIDPQKVGRRLFESLMQQVLEEDLFDRDWNPYNTLILKGNRLAIVDFWAMVSVERSFQSKLSTLMRAIAQREFRKAADYLILIGPPVPPTHNANEVRRQVIHTLRTFDVRARAKLLPYEEKALANALGEIGRILAADGSPPTFDFLEVDRAFRIADLSLKDLLPYTNVMRLHERFWEKADIRRLQNTLGRRSLRASVTSAVELIAKSPDFLSEQLTVGADVIRRQAKVFQQTSSKIAHLFESVFSLITRGLLVAGALLVSAFAYQRYPPSRAYFEWTGPRGIELLERLPPADTLEGAVILFVVLYLAKGSWQLKRQFAQKTVTRPDASEV
jgi:ubiquinone biosynthesis protein